MVKLYYDGFLRIWWMFLWKRICDLVYACMFILKHVLEMCWYNVQTCDMWWYNVSLSFLLIFCFLMKKYWHSKYVYVALCRAFVIYVRNTITWISFIFCNSISLKFPQMNIHHKPTDKWASISWTKYLF